MRYEENHTLKPITPSGFVINADSIYNYTRTIKTQKARLGHMWEGAIAVRFLDALADFGLSKARVVYYASRLASMLDWFAARQGKLADATEQDCRDCLRSITGDHYAGKTNRAVAEVFKRLVHYAKTGTIGEKRDGKDYVAVAWIRPQTFVRKGRCMQIRAADLLTTEELEAMISGVEKVSRFPVRDRALLISMYEGAFRPGEVLQMTIGGVLFKERIAVISTTGKTGAKTVPLLLSYRYLLDWISQHLLRESPDARPSKVACSALASSITVS